MCETQGRRFSRVLQLQRGKYTHHYRGQDNQDGTEYGQRQVTEQRGIGFDGTAANRSADLVAANRRGRGQGVVYQFVVDRSPTFLGGCHVVTLARFLVAAATVFVWSGPATRHALRVLPVEVQREHARRTAERTGSTAGPARRVTRFTQLGGRIVVLGARALGAQAVLEHEVRRT